MSNPEIVSQYVRLFKKTEEDFCKAIQNVGKITLATQNENIYNHWDLKLELKFDVKSLKKISREDNDTDENIHWIELMNVNGKQGSLYGKTDYFAFETNEYWVLVSCEKLQKFIAEKCKKKEWDKEPNLYKLYRREGRKDIITLVKTIDLIFISDKMIKKIN